MMTNLFDKKDVFSWATCEEARTYIDKKGYFGDSLEELKEQIKEHNLKKLLWIDDSNAICFHPEKQTVTEPNTAFFLPVDKVKRDAKKWRAFTSIDEFCTCTNKKLNNEITYRNKMTNDTFHAVITRITVSNNAIDLGAHTYSLYNLFKYYELYNDWSSDHFEWQPFGVFK